MPKAAKYCLAIAAIGLAAFGITLLAARAGSPEPTPSPADLAHEDVEAAEDDVDWEYWKGVNGDVVAWIKVEGTAIDYPVVQASAEDPTFYLHHDVYGNGSEWGCPYVDAGCADGIDAPNVVVMAHNMDDGSMFADFARFADEGYASEHKRIELRFPGGKRVLEVTSAWTIPGWAEEKKTDFVNEKSLVEYKRRCFGESGMKLASEEAATSPNRLYTFCTCSYYENPANERTLVFARKVLGDG